MLILTPFMPVPFSSLFYGWLVEFTLVNKPKFNFIFDTKIGYFTIGSILYING
jgi:hypothetical protein